MLHSPLMHFICSHDLTAELHAAFVQRGLDPVNLQARAFTRHDGTRVRRRFEAIVNGPLMRHETLDVLVHRVEVAIEQQAGQQVQCGIRAEVGRAGRWKQFASRIQCHISAPSPMLGTKALLLSWDLTPMLQAGQAAGGQQAAAIGQVEQVGAQEGEERQLLEETQPRPLT